MADALCTQVDPDTFYPEVRGSQVYKQARQI